MNSTTKCPNTPKGQKGTKWRDKTWKREQEAGKLQREGEKMSRTLKWCPKCKSYKEFYGETIAIAIDDDTAKVVKAKYCRECEDHGNAD